MTLRSRDPASKETSMLKCWTTLSPRDQGCREPFCLLACSTRQLSLTTLVIVGLTHSVYFVWAKRSRRRRRGQTCVQQAPSCFLLVHELLVSANCHVRCTIPGCSARMVQVDRTIFADSSMFCPSSTPPVCLIVPPVEINSDGLESWTPQDPSMPAPRIRGQRP